MYEKACKKEYISKEYRAIDKNHHLIFPSELQHVVLNHYIL